MRSYVALPLSLGLLAVSALAADEKQPAPGKARGGAAPKAPVARPAAPNAQFEKLLKMSPEERYNFLKNVTPQRRENLQRRLDEVEKMGAARKMRVLTRVEMLHSLPVEKQQQVRRSIKQYDELPPDRQAVIGRELQKMASLPDEERREHMNSEEFRNRYSVTEQQMMSNLSTVTP